MPQGSLASPRGLDPNTYCPGGLFAVNELFLVGDPLKQETCGLCFDSKRKKLRILGLRDQISKY